MSIIYQKLSIFVHRVEKDRWYKIVSAQDILMKKQTQAARKSKKAYHRSKLWDSVHQGSIWALTCNKTHTDLTFKVC